MAAVGRMDITRSDRRPLQKSTLGGNKDLIMIVETDRTQLENN